MKRTKARALIQIYNAIVESGVAWEVGRFRVDADPLPQRDLGAQEPVPRWRLRLRQKREARGGRALLAGLLSCGRCGRRLKVSYSGRSAKQTVYRCDLPPRAQPGFRSPMRECGRSILAELSGLLTTERRALRPR